MKLAHQLTNIIDYQFYRAVFFTLNSAGLLSCFDNNLIIDSSVKSFKLFKNAVFIQKDNCLQIRNTEGKLLQSRQGIFYLLRLYVTDSFFFIPEKKGDQEVFRYYDCHLGEHEVEWQNSFVKTFFDNVLISQRKKIFSCLNMVTGQLLWQLNFCDLLQNDRAILHSEIIDHKGKLYFFLSGSNRNRTFCVDIESGEVLKEYDALQGWLVKDGDYIYAIRFSETVVRLDTRTNEIVEWDIQELNGIGLIAEVAQNGFIYFVQNIGVTDPKVGVLDFDNRELVWSYSFTGNHGLIGSLKVHGNRLFVHTQDNTLHIFEKE